MSNYLLKNSYRNLTLITNVRRLSSFNNNRTRSTGVASIVSNEDVNIWSENNWSQFAKQFNKSVEFPLPGQVGIAFQHKLLPQFLETKLPASSEKLKMKTDDKVVRDLLTKPLPDEDHLSTLQQAIDYHQQFDEKEFSQEVGIDMKQALELNAYPCPRSLYNDFKVYFPHISINALNVITISFKTEYDMATWNTDVESEREVVMQKFVDVAQGLCSRFQKEGYWADYVDPSCGRPHHAPYGHATFYETDERYRNFGFEILDQGCCKVISHHKWGTKCYVGCFLTNAPVDSHLTRGILRMFNSNKNNNSATTTAASS